jgi:uncharacterized protein
VPVAYATPGVYVEEVDRGTKPIEAAGTSIAAFIGVTLDAAIKKTNPDTGEREIVESVLNKAVLVTNWTQFVDVFGGLTSEAYLPDAVYGYFNNGGGPCYITSIRALKDIEGKQASVTIPAASGKAKSFEVFAKTPGPSGNALSIIVRTEEETFSVSIGGETRAGLTLKSLADAEFSTAVVGNVGSANPAEGVYALTGGEIVGLTASDFIGDAAERTGINGLEAIDEISLVLCPDLMAGYDGSIAARELVKQVQTALIAHCENMQYRFAILDSPPGLSAQGVRDWRLEVNYDTSYAALYYPWVKIVDFSSPQGGSKFVPPSGHVVGIYNRTDAERGVHKAPANEVVLGAIDLELNITKGEQGILNKLGVNCIRSFPGRGIRVWGARTLSSDGSWRYVNVRRLFNQVGTSLDTGLQWVVFEPNNHNLWAKVRRDITSFLRVIWRSGALFGTSPEAAFYVKCDEELNPPEIRDLGQLIIEVGLAPVKPAEFVILRLSQWAGADSEA